MLFRSGEVYVDCIIGFAAKDLNQYPARTKQLAELLYDKKYFVLPVNVATVAADRKQIKVENSSVAYINGTHTVEEVSKIYLKNRKMANMPDIVDALSMGDVDYALDSLDEDQAVEFNLELVEACYRSTQEPSLIFVTRKTSGEYIGTVYKGTQKLEGTGMCDSEDDCIDAGKSMIDKGVV